MSQEFKGGRRLEARSGIPQHVLQRQPSMQRATDAGDRRDDVDDDDDGRRDPQSNAPFVARERLSERRLRTRKRERKEDERQTPVTTHSPE